MQFGLDVQHPPPHDRFRLVVGNSTPPPPTPSCGTGALGGTRPHSKGAGSSVGRTGPQSVLWVRLVRVAHYVCVSYSHSP